MVLMPFLALAGCGVGSETPGTPPEPALDARPRPAPAPGPAPDAGPRPAPAPDDTAGPGDEMPTPPDFAGLEPAPETAVAIPPPDVEDKTASRQFLKIEERTIEPFAGLAVVAFPRNPNLDTRARAEIICGAFIGELPSVASQVARDIDFDRQVVTVWPVTSQQVADRLEAMAAEDYPDTSRVCPEAVRHYDSDAGEAAIADAADLFESRGKDAVSDRIDAPVQDGPWLLGWAPGAAKGTLSDDALVLAFDLSHVDTTREAAQVFQAWEHAIERNPDLWRQERISNTSWSAAIIRWANMIGRDLAFYREMTK